MNRKVIKGGSGVDVMGQDGLFNPFEDQSNQSKEQVNKPKGQQFQEQVNKPKGQQFQEQVNDGEQFQEQVNKQKQIQPQEKTFNIVNSKMFKSLFNIVTLGYDEKYKLVIKYVDYMFKNKTPPLSIEKVIDMSRNTTPDMDRYTVITKQMIDFETNDKTEFLWIVDKKTGTSTDMYPNENLPEGITDLYLKVLTYIGHTIEK